MKAPRFTDAKNFRLPYASAAESKKPGYLLRRFREYAAADQRQREAEHQARLARIERMK